MILTKEKIKEINIDELINKYLIEGIIEKILFIVPTNRKSRQLKKELLNYVKNKTAQKIKIETLETISEKLLQKNLIFHKISEAASFVFIKQAISKVKLNYYSIFKDEIPQGTLEEIRNFILELKRNGITPDKLETDTQINEESEILKAKDISAIYTEYNNICRKINAFDIGDIYENLINLDDKNFDICFNEFYCDVDLIFIDGFNEFSNPELEIINKLSSRRKTYLSFDFYKNNKIFSYIENIFDKLKNYQFNEINDTRIFELELFKKTIEEKLFISRNKVKYDFSNKLFEVKGIKINDEIELIASEIKKIIIHDKVIPSNICVAFNSIQDYSNIIRDVFDKYGLPINLTDRKSLATSSPIVSLINFLEIVENDYYYKSIFRALHSNLISTGDIDITNLKLIANSLKIISGKANWTNLLNTEFNIEFADDEITIDMIKKAHDDFNYITKLLSPFENNLSIDDFLINLTKLIYQLKIPFHILLNENEKEEYTRALTTFLDNTKEVFELLKKEFGADEKYSISFYQNQLRTICNWSRYNVKEKSNYGILITSIEEIRGLQFDYLFIGGLIDGLFPDKYSPQVFRSTTFKKKAYEHYSKQRYLFYKAITSFKKKLYLCYHLSDEKSDLVKSNFLTELNSIIDIKEINYKDYDNFIFTQEKYQSLQAYNHNNLIEESIFKNIQKAVLINNIRAKSPTEKSIYNGHLFAENEIENAELIKNFKNLKQKQFSISQLESYAKCPFKYFLERVLKIKVIEEPTDTVEPLQMGKLLHNILFEFYTTLRNEKIILQGCSDNDFNKAKEILKKIALNKVEHSIFKYPINFFDKEKILGIKGNFKNSILYKFLEEERKENDYIPQFFEVAFGQLKNDGTDELLNSFSPINVDGINLRGKIDRIEINDKTKSFNVVDYKLSGKKPNNKELLNGISLQLPIYLYATKKLLAEKFDDNYLPNDMIIYSLKYKSDDFGKKPIKNIETQNVIDTSLNSVKKYVDSITKGEFNLSTLENRKDKVCKYCDFISVCRLQEIEKDNEITNEETT